jgi:hypothetical protein
VKIPSSEFESRGKKWLETHCEAYRETRDQSVLTELLDINIVRAKKLRSFTRLEHSIEQLLEGVAKGQHIATPC